METDEFKQINLKCGYFECKQVAISVSFYFDMIHDNVQQNELKVKDFKIFNMQYIITNMKYLPE